MQRVLVSACLLGQPVRYDGGTVATEGGILACWQMEGRVVPMCPEMAGGLPVPRLPAEIHGDGGGAAVLRGAARVVEHHGHDVTEAFVQGAQRALEAAREAGVQVAVLTERSPSCGSTFLYDGSFSSQLQPGEGVTAALLREHGIRVFSQHQLEDAARLLDALDARDRAASVGKP
ncbi:DUF523 domain-containing protein [uncultured Ralstonia sp.]|jgi:uncharacterized protein YbbK (DUF523 family)|uniref:DUF523 domain-containing protein n=1 Tax=Ralstonia sp. TaxID=54061 RepID=UPI001EABEFCF|nr:DUF523 domain-containing protein [uncultured Ralstonia sp.]UCF22132.1 MAG: DUF523 domain-containing protein [Ralstonia sp.]